MVLHQAIYAEVADELSGGLGQRRHSKAVSGGGITKNLLIDRQGRVAISHAGLVERDEFARDIQELLREQ